MRYKYYFLVESYQETVKIHYNSIVTDTASHVQIENVQVDEITELSFNGADQHMSALFAQH